MRKGGREGGKMVGKLVGRWKGGREGGWVGGEGGWVGRREGERGRRERYVSFPLSPSLPSSLSLLSSILHRGEAPREEGLLNLLPRSISLFPSPEEDLPVNMPKVHM